MSEQGRDTEANDRIDALFDQLFISGLSDRDCQELWMAAVADKNVMQRYVEIVHLREGLPYLLTQVGLSESGTDGLLSGELSGDLVGEGPISGKHVADLSERSDQRDSASFVMGRWRQVLTIAVSLAFLLGAATTYLLSESSNWLPQMAGSDTPRQLRTASSAPLLPFAEESWLGSITGLSMEASDEGMLASMQVGQKLRCGEVVQLSEGFVHVRLHSGPEIIVEGPAEFSLVGKNSVFVRVGRVIASAEEGLVLQSALVTADCLDAKVSFVAEEDTSTSVYALQGVVTVFSTPQEEISSEKLRTLHSQEGMVAHPINDGKISIMASALPQGIVTSWADVEARLTKYQQLVLGDHPLAYWPLERVRRNRRVLDLSQNGFDGLAIGNWPTELSEEEIREPGTYFNGESYIESDHKPPVDVRTGFSVEAWAQPAGDPEYRAIFSSRWVYDSHMPTQQCFGYTIYAGDANRWEFWTGPGREGYFWNVIETPEEIESSHWAHVVGTFTPLKEKGSKQVWGMSRLYVNGKLAIEHEHEVSLADFEWPARIGASEYVPRYLTSWLFKGFLRDVAVYNYPLEPQRIESHHRVGAAVDDRNMSQHLQYDSVLVASLLENSAR